MGLPRSLKAAISGSVRLLHTSTQTHYLNPTSHNYYSWTGVFKLCVCHVTHPFTLLVTCISATLLGLLNLFSPSAPPENTQKPSSLKSKVKEREKRQRERDKMLSNLTAPTVPVESVSQLREGAGKNHWAAALVLMLQASMAPGARLGQEDKERLVKVNDR